MVKKKRSLGFGFSDEVIKVNSKIGGFKNKEAGDWKDSLIPNFDMTSVNLQYNNEWRVILFLIVSIVIFFILFLRLFHLQITNGKLSRELADGNRIQIKLIHAPRGIIYDRVGKILAANSPAFRIIDKQTKKTHFITREEALSLEVKKDPRAKDMEVDNLRTYPFKEELAHVLGYVGEINETQLKDASYKNYNLGDRIGKDGIEQVYENILRGKDGGEIFEVNSMGEKIRTLRVVAPVPGKDIYLNIDLDLQSKLYQLTKSAAEKSGSCCAAAIAQDPKNGAILALVSIPSFDPNIFTLEDDIKINEVFSNPSSPILNRAVSGTYPPGSTFKIVSSLAALSSGKITKSTTFTDSGVLSLGPYKFSTWYFNEYGRTEGEVNILKAIQRSNDIYYYEIAQKIGEVAIENMAKKLKMGGKLDIDLPNDAAGLIPNDEWKRENYDQVWYPGDTLHRAIGQGFVLSTPLQILGITSYIATDGVIYKPQMVNKIATSKDVVTWEFKPKILASNLVTSANIKIVKEGLELVPKIGGTAWPFFTFPIATAGKTGTAEYGESKIVGGSTIYKTHAWYSSYAPADDPKISTVVLVEGGGEGSTTASPVAKEFYRWYFSEDKTRLIKDTNAVATDSARTLGE